MAADPRTVIVTEAYSSKNIGDAELVWATLAAVGQRWPQAHVTAVALEPSSFEADSGLTFVPRLFDRRNYAGASGPVKALWLVRWALFIILASLYAIAGLRRRTRFLDLLIGTRARPAYRAYVSAEAQVAVGGGYLGDRYVKESFLTLWTWWWAVRRGVGFESMPVSIEARGRLMRTLLRVLLPSTGVVVRDVASQEIMRLLGRSLAVEPDLAFRNARQGPRTAVPNVCWLFPVGSDYFEPDTWAEQWSVVTNAVRGRELGAVAFPMHGPLEGSIAGRDAEVVAYMRTCHGVAEAPSVVRYEELVSELRQGAALVVSARMHAGIAGLCAGVPTVLLGYEEKHRTLMESLGMSDAYLPFGRFTSDELDVAISAALSRSSHEISDLVATFLADHQAGGARS